MVSLTSMKAWLKITDSASDAILPVIRDGVISMMERHTRRLFTSPAASTTEILDGGDPRRVGGGVVRRDVAADLPSIELQEEPNGGALTSLSFRDTSDAAWTAQDLTEFEVDGRFVYRVAGGEYPTGSRNIRAIYDFGYAEDAGPEDAHLFVLTMVKFLFERRDAGLIKSAGIGPMRITYATAEEAGVAHLLDGLKRPLSPC